MHIFMKLTRLEGAWLRNVNKAAREIYIKKGWIDKRVLRNIQYNIDILNYLVYTL